MYNKNDYVYVIHTRHFRQNFSQSHFTPILSSYFQYLYKITSLSYYQKILRRITNTLNTSKHFVLPPFFGDLRECFQ